MARTIIYFCPKEGYLMNKKCKCKSKKKKEGDDNG